MRPAVYALLILLVAVTGGLFLLASSLQLTPIGRATALVYALLAAAGLVLCGAPALFALRRRRDRTALVLAGLPLVLLAAAWLLTGAR